MNKEHWLDGILELDNGSEVASKKEVDDLHWLTASNKETPNFLEGIEKLEASSINYRNRFVNYFVTQNIIEIIKKQSNKIQLTQPEMRILRDFKDTFPDISIKELEEAANVLK